MLKRVLTVQLITILLSLFLTACGGGGGGASGAPQDTRIASIRIMPGAVMLTRVGEQRALRAQAYNAAGEELDATFTWSTSHPDQVAIDENGMLTAQTLGSAEIKATAEGVVSASALALVALPAANARLVADEQIVGDLVPVDNTAPYGLGFQYIATLRGVDRPDVGEVLLGTGEAPLGGRVMAVSQNGQDVIVTLEIIPLPEMFDRLALNETIDLSNAPVTIPQAVSDYYDVKANPDGSLLFTLKTGESSVATQTAQALNAVSRPLAAKSPRPIGTFANPFHPFVCDFPSVSFFKLDTLSPTITLERNLSLPIVYDESTGELRKLSLKGAVKAEFKLTNTLTAQFETKGNCKLELTRVTIPVGGPLALVFGGQVPVGIGFEVAGKVTFAGAGFVLGGKAETTAELGISCPPASSCGMINTFDVSAQTQPEWILPDGFNPDAQLRFEPSLYGFVFAKLSLGPSSTALARFLSALNIDAFEFTAGGKVGANLAPVEGQILSASYASDYKWSFDIKAGPSQTIDKLLGMIDVSLAKAEYTYSEIITTSPGASLVKADIDAFNAGDVINFTVKLDPTTVNFFPSFYNVDEVLIYRKISLPGGGTMVEPVDRVTAADGQTDFNLSWLATEPGSTAGNFFAFASTKLLPIPLLGELELKPVARNSGKMLFKTYNPITGDTNGLYYATTNGNSITPVSSYSPSLNTDPVLSPDGSKIAYRNSNGDNREIYIMDADGGNPVRLTSGAWDYDPAWSPNGQMIAFTRRDSTGSSVYVIQPDGNNLRKVFDGGVLANYALSQNAVWSYDGKKLLISDTVTPDDFGVPRDDLTVLDIATGATTILDRGNISAASWSPTENKVLYTRFQAIPTGGSSNGGSDIFIIDGDGDNKTQRTFALYDGSKTNRSKGWSPDGKRIVFVSLSTNYAAYTMDITGQNRLQVSSNTGDDVSKASWSGDGEYIFFSRNQQLYQVSPDGGIETLFFNAPTRRLSFSLF